jgi:hypothetical protein
MTTRAKTSGVRLRELVDLPAALDVPGAARIASMSPDAAYDVIARGEWPTPVLRFGKSIRVPTVPLLAALGLSAEDAAEKLDGGTPAA